MNDFKNNVEKYMALINRKELVSPGPRILFMGIHGSGVHTQMNLINKNYKISRVDLTADLLALLKREKEERKRERELKRGFKPKEFDDEGEEVPDPEIEEDPEDFDIRAHEIDCLKRVLEQHNEILINANQFDLEEGLI
mmetsp:Transcript_183/g.151  ORF Transcript_183/g.151 Transcript_183/m.151 type:complete len:139 (+) Transcript_183:1906-2322(+)